MSDTPMLDLQERLGRLAAAVPVDAVSTLDRVRPSPMRRGAMGRRVAYWGLVQVIALIVGATLLGGALRIGPFGPGVTPSATAPRATAPATSRPDEAVVGSASDGPYAIELRAGRRVYRASDAIDITGSFTYTGTDAIDVQGFKPLVFAVREPVYGIELDMLTTLECNHVTLEPGERFESPFRKGGGVSTSDPEYERKKAYLADPVLRLPPGTWHIRLAGWLFEGQCGDPKTALSTEIEIVVLPDPAAS